MLLFGKKYEMDKKYLMDVRKKYDFKCILGM